MCVSHPEQEIECANTVLEHHHASTSEAGVPIATSHPQTDAGSAQRMWLETESHLNERAAQLHKVYNLCSVTGAQYYNT